MTIQFRRLNHITIAVPAGKHAEARKFYGEVMGLEEVPFPEELIPYYDLIWYKICDFLIHLDFSPPFFKPAENRHPCFEVKNISAVRRELEKKGADIRQAIPIHDRERFYVVDPFGNYIELLEMNDGAV